MNAQRKTTAGFTLVETVAVLVMTGLALVFMGMLLVTSVQIYLNSATAAEDSQKIQAAMNRLVKELTWARAGSVSTTDGRQVEWVSYHSERVAEGPQLASWNGTSGSPLLLEGAPLLDNVDAFEVSLSADSILITVSSGNSPGVTHATRLHPRYEQ